MVNLNKKILFYYQLRLPVAGMAMRLEMRTKLPPEKAMSRAMDFFGRKGLGLTLKSWRPDYMSFEGGGGGIWIAVQKVEGGTRMELVSREWDQQVLNFVRKIGR